MGASAHVHKLSPMFFKHAQATLSPRQTMMIELMNNRSTKKCFWLVAVRVVFDLCFSKLASPL